MEIQELKAEIKQLAADGRAIGASLHGQHGSRRTEIRRMKRMLGKSTRYLLVQYAYRRGVPYRALEAKIHPENRLDAGWLASSWNEPLEKVQAWLDMPLLVTPKPGASLFTKEEVEALKREMEPRLAAALQLPIEFVRFG